MKGTYAALWRNTGNKIVPKDTYLPTNVCTRIHSLSIQSINLAKSKVKRICGLLVYVGPRKDEIALWHATNAAKGSWISSVGGLHKTVF
jgi:hypothetical protein